jgi:DHA2 family multidrug resistance protein
MLSFAVGVGLFGSVYLLPMLLATVKHYNSFQIGSVMFIAGIFQFASGPITGMAARRMEPRIMLFMGLFFMGLGTFINGFMTKDIGYNDLILPQAIRGISIMMCFVPMTTITLSRLPKKEVKNASGLYNLMRNLGGAIGIAVIDTVLTNRIKFHSAFLSEFINSQKLNQIFGSGKMLSDDLGSGVFQMQSLLMKTTQLRINQQALVLGFNDLFCYVGIYLILCCALVFLIKPVKAGKDIPHH